ncbi:AraC family transcriptional regulator [Faecalispora anaeroviscerum]|uniref:AraC family transcriptional regulator n=1 Tax=Faecalispora anaeroviscerum TaxID=2991836 RepID=UPI0024B959B5|nr:AraC family transcriptional regulator [Faecalispora anaeroviscerum]
MGHYAQYKENFSNDFSIEHKVSTQSEKINFHIHDVFEILLNLSDNIQCMIQDKTYILRPNTLLLFNNMDLHLIRMLPQTKRNDRYVLYFKPELIEPFSSASTNLLECFFFRPFPDASLLYLNPDEAQDILVLLSQLNYQQNHLKEEQNHPQEPFGQDLMMKFLFGQLLIKINRIYRRQHSLCDAINTETYGRIYEIIQYIHKNYTEKLSLDFLSQKFYINKFYLCELFRKVMGMTPTQYLISCRISKSKELLLNQYSVDDVCALVGYNSLAHFSHSFKQHTGKSPKQYQMSHENNSLFPTLK